MVEIVTLIAALAVIALVFVYTLIIGNPPTPTSPRVRARLMAVLPPLGSGSVFELGSGWGTLAFPLARRFPERPVIAVERAPVPWLASRLRLALAGPPNLKIERGDFLARPLDGAALVVCYLHAPAMARLKTKLEAELTPGCWVLSHTFRMAGWEPVRTEGAGDLYRTPVYLYRMD